uniref:Uncharacterized protein n=1 Tax=Arundo donax TaxID=35708 RepID=A0A0A9A9Y8_ARUDO
MSWQQLGQTLSVCRKPRLRPCPRLFCSLHLALSLITMSSSPLKVREAVS